MANSAKAPVYSLYSTHINVKNQQKIKKIGILKYYFTTFAR